MCCSRLQCAVMCCSVAALTVNSKVAVCCSALQRVAVCRSALQCVAVCCSVSQCVAVRFSVLQCVAVSCSVLQWVVVCQSLATSYMGWLRLVGSLKFQVSFAKEPNKRDYILQKRHIISSSLLHVATPYKVKDNYRDNYKTSR